MQRQFFLIKLCDDLQPLRWSIEKWIDLSTELDIFIPYIVLTYIQYLRSVPKERITDWLMKVGRGGNITLKYLKTLN